jgi:hypothetical protein
MQQFGRVRVESGHRADIVDQSKMILLGHERTDFAEMHGKEF